MSPCSPIASGYWYRIRTFREYREVVAGEETAFGAMHP